MRKSVHILEDDEDISELITLLLSEQGYEVSAFRDVASFRKQADGTLPSLLIVDIMLPDGNGLDVCREWKTGETTRRTPILLMSAFEDYRNDSQATLADGFISKPFDIGDFLAEVRRWTAPETGVQ